MHNSSKLWYYTNNSCGAYTASNGHQYTTGFYGTARRCQQCATPCKASKYNAMMYCKFGEVC